jgi:hypothetical protein
MNLLFRAGLAGALLATAPGAVLACSSCGCSASTDYTGASPGTGLRLEARFDFVDQNQLRLGSHVTSKSPDAFPTEHEFQQGTLTRFYTLGADYSFNRDWGLNVQLPYLVREHQTIGEEQDTTEVSTSETRGLGDLRLVGRWSGLSEDRSWTLQAGLKLPTGKHLQTFRDGPLAGEVIDRGLQNGSGSTDLILGIAHTKPLSRDWDHFEQLQVRQPFNKVDGFRPSTQVTANVGLRYVGYPRIIPQLQLNARVEGRETGVNADYANSGSQAIYVTPGLSGTLVKSLAAYGFVQLPVYQHYTGYQLAPRYLVSVGLSYGF